MHLALYCFASSQLSTALSLLYRARYLMLLVFGEDHPEMALLDVSAGAGGRQGPSSIPGDRELTRAPHRLPPEQHRAGAARGDGVRPVAALPGERAGRQHQVPRAQGPQGGPQVRGRPPKRQGWRRPAGQTGGGGEETQCSCLPPPEKISLDLPLFSEPWTCCSPRWLPGRDLRETPGPRVRPPRPAHLCPSLAPRRASRQPPPCRPSLREQS